jgi:hypothetical protein
MNAATADFVRTLDSLSQAIQQAAITTLEAHRPTAPDHLSHECVTDFLRTLSTDTAASAHLVEEALGEELVRIDYAGFADAAVKLDAIDAGLAVIKVVRRYAHGVLAANYTQVCR